MADAAPARVMGFWSAVALVVGSMIGSGVFLLPANLAPYGAASLLGWGISLCGAILLALVYAQWAREDPLPGGSFAYTRVTFGDTPGFFVAWSNWICIWAGNAALAVACAGCISALVPAVAQSRLLSAAIALAALWIATLTNLAGVRESARAQVVLTVLKLVPIALFAFVAVFFVDTANYHPFLPEGGDLFEIAWGGAAITLWAFLGLEASTIASASIRDPEKNVARATVVGTLIAGFLTMLACTVVLGVLPRTQIAQSPAPMAEAAAHLFGAPAGVLLAITAAVASYGALNGWVMLMGELPAQAAQAGLFPRSLGLRDGNGTPRRMLLVGTVLGSVLIVANYSRSLVKLFEFSILLSTATSLLPYAAASASALLRSRRWRSHSPMNLIIAGLALGYSLFALAGTGREALFWGAVLLAAGIPVSMYVRIRKRGLVAPH
ncbi:MAG: amino acid permease [Xanthomonadales bacterium]|nr:amino acid permease [Xanthomonadales bacterium]